MSVHDLAEKPAPTLVNILLWDALEMEWRIGHLRAVIEGMEPYYCACSVSDAHDLITSDLPVPIFADVTHWSRLPDQPGVPA